MKHLKSILAAVLLTGLLLGCTPDQDAMTVTFPKIGKADCSILIQSDQVMVIDCGEAENSGEILQTLKGLGVTRIDCLVITHFDKDHVGGAADILNALPVSQVLEPDYTPENPQSESYLAYRQALTDTKVPCLQVTDSKTFSLGTASVTVTGTGGKTYDKNVDNNNALPDFFQAVGMQYAVITCSEKNPADPETLSTLAERNVKTYLTSDGQVTVASTVSGLCIRQGIRK